MQNNKLPLKRLVRVALITLLFGLTGITNANPVDGNYARQVATNFLNLNRAQANGLTDISASVGYNNLYVFTTENSFVVMSADDRVKPILGYSLTGSFSTENMPENVSSWLQGYNEQIQDVVDNYTETSNEVIQQWRELSTRSSHLQGQRTIVGPLITTSWDQGYPYNYYCPSASGGNGGHVYTGCVATAMAQVIKYHNAPVHGIGSHTYTHSTYGEQSANFGGTNYSWTNMPTYITSSSSQTQINAVARLMYHCGVSVNMNYGIDGSGTSSSYIAPALKYYFNFSQSTTYVSRTSFSGNDSGWSALIRSELTASRPVIYNGTNSDATSGHSFVCDGYDTSLGSYYFHFNWGWSGQCDGYFSIDAMTPGGSGAGSGGHNYSYNQDAVIGIKPSTNTANPSNLTYTQNGGNVTLNWSSASGASTYKIYRGGIIVGASTSNSFTENALYGSNVYFVRSVDSNGELSLSSNTITVTISYPTPSINDLAATITNNNVSLTWTAPEWCYPETPTATLSYGNGDFSGYSAAFTYYAHRYPSSTMAQYANKSVYKIGTYILFPGTYTVYIYTNSTSSTQPGTLVATKVINCSEFNCWLDIILDNPVTISGNNDLWVVMKQENTGQSYPVPLFMRSSYSSNACYYGTDSPTSLSYIPSSSGNISWFIKTYVTDGVYTYNIYRDGSAIATNVGNTTYTDGNLSQGTYNYYVKTKYYGGLSNASNQVSAPIEGYYNITVSVNPTNGGTITGAGSYHEGNTCTLTATANNGYTFSNWSKNGTVVSQNATYSFTVTEAGTYTANFVLRSYAINATADPAAGGTATGGNTYNHGQSCTLTATANEGYVFVNWTENGTQVSTNANYIFNVTGPRNLVAHFQPTYTISATANPTGGGTVSSGGVYINGQSCTLTATANTGYTFLHWTENGNVVSTNATYSFNVTGPRSLVAQFQANSYSITAAANPQVGGTVSGSNTYTYGQSCTLTANANTGYTFLRWTENGSQVSTNASYSFTVTSNRNLVAQFQINTYTVNAIANIEAGGSVSGSGTYTHGQSCTVTAMANTGYTFLRWTENGNELTTDTCYSFNVTDNRNLVAQFQINTYTITAIADSTGFGSVSGGGTYSYGETCTLIAQSNPGFVVVNWTENGNVVSTVSTYSFTISEDRTLMANFAEAESGQLCGVFSIGANKQVYFSSGNLQYQASTNTWRFATNQWDYEGLSNTNISSTYGGWIDLFGWGTSGYHDIYDDFNTQYQPYSTFSNTVNTSCNTYGYGPSTNMQDPNLTGTSAEYDWGVHNAIYNGGSEAGIWRTLTQDEWNYLFKTRAASTVAGTANARFVMATVNGVYGVILFPDVYSHPSYLPNPLSINSATAAFSVNSFTGEGWTAMENLGCVFLPAAGCRRGSTTIIYSNNNTCGNYGIYWSTTKGGVGNAYHLAFKSGNLYYCDYAQISKFFSSNTSASYSTYGRFSGYSVRLVRDIVITSHTIGATANPEYGGMVTGGGTYDFGELVTLTATPASGFSFTNWTENGAVVSTNTSYSFYVTGDRDLVANFEAIPQHTITVYVNPSNSGIVTGGGIYNQGETATLTATANEGYAFVRWTENGNEVSTDMNYSFLVMGNRVLVANFQPTYAIGATADPNEGGTITGDGPFPYGQICTLTATANQGYAFLNWTENGSVVSNSENYVFIVTSDRTLVAHFQATNTISLTASPTSGGVVMGAGTYTQGQSCTVTAIPNAGYTFVNWTEGGTQVSANASYTFTVTGNRSLVANFQQQTFPITLYANPSHGGAVIGGGAYNYGNTCTVTATANEGYTFVCWTEDGTQVSTNASYTFTVVGNRTLTAQFQINSYTITTSPNNLASGSVSEGGTFLYGDTCTVTATANEGYLFASWTENGAIVSTSQTYNFIVGRDRILVANFTAVPDGPGQLGGVFSVGGNTLVFFSQGNLQYIGSAATPYWKFAEHQWDYFGTTTGQNSSSETADRDLFGWGTSGYNHGATSYQPWATGTTYSYHYAYGNSNYNLYDQTGQADWGYNAISNGGNQENSGWRTLTYAEWNYLINTRTDASSKKGHGKVNGVNGLILLPDNWTLPNGLTFTPGNSSWTNVYTTEQWVQMEANGAVFLPAAGYRNGTSLSSVGSYGYYWSSTMYTNKAAYDLYFYSGTSYIENNYRHNGSSVRLVCPIQQYYFGINATPNTEEGGVVSGSGTYLGGSTCTLTAVANPGYVFVNWTKDGEVISPNAIYSFTVAEDANYVANFVEEVTELYWTPQGSAYSETMTLYGIIQINGLEQYSDQLEVGAFCGDECRGAALPHEFNGHYLVGLQIYGENGHQLTFKLYDHSIGQELNLVSPQAISFNDDGLGTPIAPCILNFTQPVEIAVIITPEDAGTVTGTGNYTIGSTCTLVATVNSGYQFANWSLDGIVMSTDMAYTFTVSGTATLVAHFYKIHTQALSAGWSWWSTYIEQNGMNGLEMLENSIGSSGIRIQSRTGSVDQFEYQGSSYWYGTGLDHLENEQMYKIRTNADCNAVIVGDEASLANHPITINNGWNWIGFPSSQSIGIEDAMGGFNPEADDVIKGRNGFATFVSVGSYNQWYGSLTALEPGQGYKYKSNSTGPKTLTYQYGRAENIVSNHAKENLAFTAYEANYANNMMVNAIVELEGQELHSEDYELAVFVGDECRGSVRLMYVEPFDRYVAFLLVFGDETEEMDFALTDGRSISWSDDHLMFTPDGISGTLMDPFVLHFGPMDVMDVEQKIVNIYPNPSKGVFNVEGENIRRIEVIDAYGHIIYIEEVESDHLQINLGHRAIGVYLLRIITDEGIVTKRIIKK